MHFSTHDGNDIVANFSPIQASTMEIMALESLARYLKRLHLKYTSHQSNCVCWWFNIRLHELPLLIVIGFVVCCWKPTQINIMTNSIVTNEWLTVQATNKAIFLWDVTIDWMYKITLEPWTSNTFNILKQWMRATELCNTIMSQSYGKHQKQPSAGNLYYNSCEG